MRRAVIGTNIIVTAILSSNDEAATVKVLELLLNGHILPVVTDSILQEYEEVLRRKKFSFPEENVSVLLNEIRSKSVFASPCKTDTELPDENDRPFFEAMLSDDDIVLITGNIKHFPDHERVMTARMFLDLYEESVFRPVSP